MTTTNTTLTIETQNYGTMPAYQCPVCGELGIHPEHLGDIQGLGWVTETDIHGVAHTFCGDCCQNGAAYEMFDIPCEDDD